MSALPPLTVATDGSALHNPGWGGWAWVAEDGTSHAGGHRRATNNHMELRAVLEAMRGIDPARSILIQTDSQYVRDVFTKWLPVWQHNGMRKRTGEPVLNANLILEIAKVRAARAAVTFEWVRGHSGHRLNEQANNLAQAAARHAEAVVTANGTPTRKQGGQVGRPSRTRRRASKPPPSTDRMWAAQAAQAERDLQHAARQIDSGETGGDPTPWRRETPSRAGRGRR